MYHVVTKTLEVISLSSKTTLVANRQTGWIQQNYTLVDKTGQSMTPPGIPVMIWRVVRIKSWRFGQRIWGMGLMDCIQRSCWVSMLGVCMENCGGLHAIACVDCLLARVIIRRVQSRWRNIDITGAKGSRLSITPPTILKTFYS